MIRTRYACLVAILCIRPGGDAAADDGRTVPLRGQPLGCEAPVVLSIQDDLRPGTYVVQAEKSAATHLAQVFEDEGRKWLATIMAPGRIPERITVGPCPESILSRAALIAIEPRGSGLVVSVDKDLFTEYHADGVKPYLFPLNGPGGVRYTRAYPMETVAGEDRDHPHQRSFWFTHGKVNGVDFWSETRGHGTIRETARKTIASGPVLARLRTTDDWLGPDGTKILEDERVITFFPTMESRVVDFEITLRASNGPVTFGDTKEGSFGLRVASTMDVAKKLGGKIVNAEGLEDDRAWGKPSPWVDYSGPVEHRGPSTSPTDPHPATENRRVGIAILNHPDSFRYPTTWHVRTYGLFAANPFGWHDFGVGKTGEYTLPAGRELRLKYRVILHRGGASDAHLREAFDAYSKPPEVVRPAP